MLTYTTPVTAPLVITLAPMSDWEIALAVACIVIVALLFIGTVLGFIDWSDK